MGKKKMIHQNSLNRLLSSGNTQCAISLTNETWQHNSVQFSILAGKGENSRRDGGGEREWKRARKRECVLLAHPSGCFPSQTSVRERVCKGSQGLQRAKHCLNKWCYHNTFVSTPSVSLMHSLTHAPHPSPCFIIIFLSLHVTINIKLLCRYMSAYYIYIYIYT